MIEVPLEIPSATDYMRNAIAGMDGQKPFQLYDRNRYGPDYQFIDRTVKEMLFVSGMLCIVHKYIGPPLESKDFDNNHDGFYETRKTAHKNQKKKERLSTISDLLFEENRQRRFEKDVVELWGQVSLLDNEMEQNMMGLFMSNDSLNITLHINSVMDDIGRKLIPGDVIELPHLIDDTALDVATKGPMRKFYAVQDIVRSAEGYDPTWQPHLFRVKCKVVADTPEYNEIMNLKDADGHTMREQVSNFGFGIEISEALHREAENLALSKQPDTAHLEGDAFAAAYEAVEAVDLGSIADRTLEYIPPLPFKGKVAATYAGADPIFDLGGIGPEDNTRDTIDLGAIKGDPPTDVRSGNTFPSDAGEGAYFIHTDFAPPRLYRKQGTRWLFIQEGRSEYWQPLIEKFRSNSGSFISDSGEEIQAKDSAVRVGKRDRPTGDNI